jgi:hypothetical protein
MEGAMNQLFPPAAVAGATKSKLDTSATKPARKDLGATQEASEVEPGISGSPKSAARAPESQFTQHSESHVGDPPPPATPLAETETLTGDSRKPEKADSDAGDFDWSSDNEDIVLREQRALAVYWNTRGDLVIRQERYWDEIDDPFLVIGRNNVDAFLDRLCDVVGIPSAGKSKP